jgi:hypothetical protein
MQTKQREQNETNMEQKHDQSQVNQRATDANKHKQHL